MFKQVKQVEILLFTKHLGVMVKAGIPLTQALNNLSIDSKNIYFSKVIAGLTKAVESGKSLEQALSAYPQIFNAVYLSLVRIGEESGNLDTTLKELSLQLTKIHALKRKVAGAMLYPGLVVISMILIGAALSLFVLPKLVDFFAAFEQQLPLSTRILLWFANIMKNDGFMIIGGLILVFAIVGYLLRLPSVKKYTDRWIFSIPLLGNFIRQSELASLSRNLSILLSSGVPLVKAFDTLIVSTSNIYLHSSLSQIQTSLQTGKKISTSINNLHLTAFPNIFVEMVSVGESTGNLDAMLLYLADYYEDEVDATSKNLTTLLEPILLLIVGLAVGFMALAIIGPIYQITGSIGG